MHSDGRDQTVANRPQEAIRKGLQMARSGHSAIYKARENSGCNIWPLLGLLRLTCGTILLCCTLGGGRFRDIQNKHID